MNLLIKTVIRLVHRNELSPQRVLHEELMLLSFQDGCLWQPFWKRHHEIIRVLSRLKLCICIEGCQSALHLNYSFAFPMVIKWLEHL